MNTTFASGLKEEQRRQFEHDGYLCPMRVLSDDEVRHYLSCYTEYTARHQERLGPAHHVHPKAHGLPAVWVLCLL